jgi:ribonuclease-3 family protein
MEPGGKKYKNQGRKMMLKTIFNKNNHPLGTPLKQFSVKELSPLVWAYVGDAVYELFVRTSFVVSQRSKLHELHKTTTSLVKAESQAEILRKLTPFLKEEEKEIVNRGRNTKSKTTPQNVDAITYRYSTGFEALLGYLYLTQQEDRLVEIISRALDVFKNDC